MKLIITINGSKLVDEMYNFVSHHVNYNMYSPAFLWSMEITHLLWKFITFKIYRLKYIALPRNKYVVYIRV